MDGGSVVYADSLGRRVTPIVVSLFVVVLVRITNLVPRFIDRSVGSFGEPGLVASLEYSYAFITLPVTLIYSAFLYTEYSRWNAGEGFVTKALTVCGKLFVGCAILTALAYVISSIFMDDVMLRLGIADSGRVLLVEIFTIHLLAVPFILCGMVLMSMLVVMKLQLWLFGAVVCKLLAKILLVYVIVPEPSSSQLAYSLVAVEVLLVATLVFAVTRKRSAATARPRRV